MLGAVQAVQFHVDDIDAAARWYADLVGTAVEYENPRYAFVRTGTHELGFHPADAKSPASTGGTVVYFRVARIDAVITTLTARGATLWRGPALTVRHERVCQMRDPFGAAFGLIEPVTAA